MFLIYLSYKYTDTEHIRKMFPDNIIFSTEILDLATQHPVFMTAVLLNSFMVKFRERLWSGLIEKNGNF